MTPAAPAGTGVIHVVRNGSRSVVCRAFAASPLKLLTPRNHGSAAWVYLASYGGGLLGGDSLRLTIEVGTDASAVLSTQASTKIYRSVCGASVSLDANVGDRGLLVVAPDPVVCYANASYRQTQQFSLAAGAGLVVIDWLTSGRRAMGERWAFAEYSSRTRVFCGTKLVLHDALSLCARDGAIAERMARFDVLGLVILIGATLQEGVDHVLTGIASTPVTRRSDDLVSASRITAAGCVLRIAGRSVETVGRLVREYLSFLPALLGDDPWARKW